MFGAKFQTLPAALQLLIAWGSVAGFVLLLGCILLLGFFLFATAPPATPTHGYEGEWKPDSRPGRIVETRDLPASNRVLEDLGRWPERALTTRYYVAKMGGHFRQSDFQVSYSRGDTPMGAQEYTNVSFLYRDETNGTYRLHWFMRGKHDVGFLQMDNRARTYFLRPHGQQSGDIPELEIEAIEGVSPFDR